MDEPPQLTHAASRLLERHIDSAGALDLLLLLHEDPARAWTVTELCDVLACPPAWADAQLAQFRAAGLVVEAACGWRYVTRSPSAPAVDQLARADRAALTRLIFAPPRHRRPVH